MDLTNLNLNLNVQIREVYSDEYAAGKVISSTPAAGESIKKGDSILLTVSKGPETKPVTVQNYAGLSVDDAALQAENAGSRPWALTSMSTMPPCRRAASSARASLPKRR